MSYWEKIYLLLCKVAIIRLKKIEVWKSIIQGQVEVLKWGSNFFRIMLDFVSTYTPNKIPIIVVNKLLSKASETTHQKLENS